jgi:hypothetical protein
MVDDQREQVREEQLAVKTEVAFRRNRPLRAMTPPPSVQR